MKSSRWVKFGVPLLVAGVLVICGSPRTGWTGFQKGPYLQDLRQGGVTIVWQQENTGPGTVTIDGVDYPATGTGLVQEVRVTGLDPHTTYSYTVDADGASDTGSFTTAPSDPLTSFRFVAMGDNRSSHNDHQAVVNAIIAEGPINFIVNTGDMVSSGEVEEDWQFFFDIEYLLIKDTPFFPTVGNHEEYNGSMPNFYTDYLAPPTDTSGSEAYYSFTYANAAFIVLDGHVNVQDSFDLWLYTDFDSGQKAWLQSLLSVYSGDPAIQHIFVFTHEPPYSSKDGRYGSHALRELMPTLDQFGIDAIVTGHDHYIERGESPSGMRYYIMGGGGAPLYDNESEGNLGSKSAAAIPWFDDAHTVHFARKAFGYMIVDILNGQVDVQVKDIQGNVLDTLSWNTGDITPPDGGVPDAGVEPDSAVTQPDSSVSQPDAGVESDAAAQGPDAAVIPGSGSDSGCGCRSLPNRSDLPMPLVFVVFVLFGLALIRRR